MGSFTPKPWTLDESISPELLTDDYHQVEGGRGYMPHGFCLTSFMSEADARLITLAPDLYEALSDMVDLHEYETERPSVAYAIDLLMKVKGASNVNG